MSNLKSVMANLKTYVYIMGRGHSGSTLLGSLLDNVEGVQDTGEIFVGLPRLQDKVKQNPNAPAVKFWRKIVEDFERRVSGLSWEAAVNASYQQAHIRKFFQTLRMNERDAEVKLLRTSIVEIAESVARVGNAHSVLDSSKEITRGLFVARFIPNARIIHLVRHPEQVIASTLHRIRHMHGFRIMRRNVQLPWMEPFFVAVAVIAWNIGNALCEMIKRRYPDKVITVRYEDICADLESEMVRIGDHIGKDLSELVEKVKTRTPLSSGLKIAGNRMIGHKTFVFDADRSDRDLSSAYSMMCRSISSVLMGMYNYR